MKKYLFLILALLLLVLLLQSSLAYAAAPSGYTSDKAGNMAYRLINNKAIDVMANYLYGDVTENWIRITYDYDADDYNGFKAMIPEDATYENDLKVTAKASFQMDGRYVLLTYSLTNTGSAPISGGKFGVHSDIMIGDNDDATIETIKDAEGEGIGVKMVDSHNSNSCISPNAQLNLYFSGSGLSGADTYWFGHYTLKEENCFNQINEDSVSDIDSGVAFSWNFDLAPGETKDFSFRVGVGEMSDPPKWAAPLSMTVDAAQSPLELNVTASVQDESGVVDTLYYSKNDGESVKLGTVTANGGIQKINAVLDLSALPEGTYSYHFWLVNSKGAMSDDVECVITIDNGRILVNNVPVPDSGAIAELPQTGDDTNLMFWSALAFISTIGMMALVRKKKQA
ncbi:MAG: LPXTG cell wall anchor domain-containing protein [Clostridia bacterium]|nr:LPXTG cell wall anchor domain-containing protein [Clostridia bacterium]